MEKKEDTSFDASIEELANSVIELEKQEYHSDLEPFELHAKKRRQQLHDYFYNFKKTFSHGYQVLFEEIEKEKTAKRDLSQNKYL